MTHVLVTCAGGFIDRHLVGYLEEEHGYRVRGAGFGPPSLEQAPCST